MFMFAVIRRGMISYSSSITRTSAMILTLGLLAACGGATDADRPASAVQADAPQSDRTAALDRTVLERRWLITAFDGQAPAAAERTGTVDRRPSVAFTRTGYGATAGCNALGGLGTLHGARYYTMPGPQTLIGCQGALANQENILDAVMRASPTITVSEGEMQLSGGGHRLTLRRDPQSNSAVVESAPMLAGTRFQIQSIDGTYLTPRSQAENRPLGFDAGEWTAKPVCGTISGKWRQDGWTLRASDVVISREGCNASADTVDTAVRDLFASEPNFSVGPNGELLIAGGGHWIAAERDAIAAARDTPGLTGSWDIVQLDGRPPAIEDPAGQPPRIDFSATAYTGSTGCNSILGGFVARGSRLYTSPGPTIEKGCGALTAQENRIYALLRAAPQIGRAGSDIQLIDDAGSMVIRRTSRVSNAGPAAWPLPTRYTGIAISLNGEPTQNRVSDPVSRITIAGNDIRIDIGCGVASAVIRRERQGVFLTSNASSSDGGNCAGARRAQHDRLMRLLNGPADGIVDSNGDLLLAGEGVWLTARTN